jgi:hypothetical protein
MPLRTLRHAGSRRRWSKGVAYDTPIPGYGGTTTNLLRLWNAEALAESAGIPFSVNGTRSAFTDPLREGGTMKRTIMGMIAIAIIASTARPPTAQASEPSAGLASGEITLRGTVEAVDQNARTVSVRGEKGNVVTIDIPQTGTSIDKLQPGDVVSVRYHDRVSVRRKRAGPNRQYDQPSDTTAPRSFLSASGFGGRLSNVL